jgi:hypothetical protein
LHSRHIHIAFKSSGCICVYLPLPASEEAIVLLCELINDLDGFCSNIFYSNSQNKLLQMTL